MTALLKYDAACRALAEAVTVDEAKDIRDKAEAMRVYAQQARNYDLEADASEIRERAERRLGTLLIEAKEAGQIAEGRPPKNCPDAGQFPRVKLDDIGIDRNLSSRAQKKAGIAEQAFEAMVARMRERIASKAVRVDDNVINGARSLMGSRQEPDDSLDYFPTPPWATRALMERVLPVLGNPHICSAWEPACGEGHIAEVLQEYVALIRATDVFDYGYGDGVMDFLDPGARMSPFPDFIITNPPFGDKAVAFVLRALENASVGVAMFFRLQWIPTKGRYESLFRDNPPTLVAFFTERVPIIKGQWDPTASTATDYIWLVWLHGAKPQAPFWIPPGQREALSRPDDAERFTAHPVIKRSSSIDGEPYDQKTGEIQPAGQQ